MSETQIYNDGPARFFSSLKAAWDAFFSVAYILRFSLSASVVASILLTLPNQSVEALRVMAEDRIVNPTPLLWFSAALLLLSLASWYFARILLYAVPIQSPATDNAGEKEWRGAASIRRWGIRHLPRIAGVLPMVCSAVAFWRSTVGDGELIPSFDKGFYGAVDRYLVGLALCCLVLAALVYVFFVFRRRLIRVRSATPIGPGVGTHAFPRSTYFIVGLAAIASAELLVVFTVAPVAIGIDLGPLAILLVAIGATIPAGSFLIYVKAKTGIPVLTIITLAALCFALFDWNENHDVRLIPRDSTTVGSDDGNMFRHWLNARPDLHSGWENGYPVIVVGAEGGGIRAAYQTALVLTALQDENPAFAHHIYAISGVSGGGVGATIFGSLVHNGLHPRGIDSAGNRPITFRRAADEILSRDLLAPVLAMGAFPDLIQRFLPFPVGAFDRGRALEYGLENAWCKVIGDSLFAASFYRLGVGFPNIRTPMLLLNTTEVRTGNRTVISSVPIRDRDLSHVPTLESILPTRGLRISTASGLSARFALVTPSGAVTQVSERGIERHRFVDGGYYDNSGMATLEDIITAMRLGRNMRVDGQKIRLIVLRIGFTHVTDDMQRPGDHRQRGAAFEEFLTPARALLNARDARARTAIAQLRATVASLTGSPRSNDARVLDFEFNDARIPLPLGWLLSQRAREEMTAQLLDPDRNRSPHSMHARFREVAREVSGL